MGYNKEFFEQLITQSEIPEENIIKPPKYSAVIQIGNLHIYLTDKTFTENQIKNMREYFGWEVKNLCESQSEIQIIIMQKKKLIVSTQM